MMKDTKQFEALGKVESGADFCTAFMPDSERQPVFAVLACESKTSRRTQRLRRRSLQKQTLQEQENSELAEPIRLENEVIRTWKKSKTKWKVESWASPLSPTLSRGEREQVVGEFMSRTTAGEGAINCAKHDTNSSSYRPIVLSSYKKAAFTLAEVLITLGVLGVVAAVTLPTLLTNVQERVRKEQLRSAKYKLTLATDKMKSMGLLENQYPTTMDFINELKKHFKIAMVCDNKHLTDCWPSDKIEIPTKNGMTTKDVTSIKTGEDLKALGIGTRTTETVGIVTADGVPMIMTYSPRCTPLDSARTYSWSTVDNKPETNATTNCISAIMDINGTGKPNRLGKDVRTWNSIMGYQKLPAQSITYDECTKWKNKLGIKDCFVYNNAQRDDDYFGGAVKACYDLGLHLPSTQTLALIAGSKYGRSDITPYTVISSVQFTKSYNAWSSWRTDDMSCETIWKQVRPGSYQIICIDNGDSTNATTAMGNNDTSSSLMSGTTSFSGYFWSASEVSQSVALVRSISGNGSSWFEDNRKTEGVPLCLGD